MQTIILVIGCICTLIILVHLYMSEIDKHTLFRVSEKVLLICILIATVFFGVIPEIVMVTHKQQYDIAQDLLHTSGKVYDANKHTVDIEIEDVGQIDILSVDNYYKTDDYYIVYYVRVDVEVPQGYLRGVPVIVEKNIFGTDTIVKWDYSLEDKMFYYEKYGQDDSDSDSEYEKDAFGNRHDVKFEFTNAPSYTIGDLFNYIGISAPHDIAEASVTSITNNYDALEYYILWRSRDTGKTMDRWVRAVYDKETGKWNLCSAEKKESTLNSKLAGYASGSDDTYDNDYTDDYRIVESNTFLGWTKVEQ